MPDHNSLLKTFYTLLRSRSTIYMNEIRLSFDNEPPLINAFNEWNRYQHQ